MAPCPKRRRPRRGQSTCVAALARLILAMPTAGLASTAAASQGQAPTTPPAQVCDAVAARVARESGVPIEVLQAITRTETGRRRDGRVEPWPWTVNMEGRGVWFDTPDEARGYVYQHYQRGARSFDVGCFQINFRWHGQHFASIEEMFDPLANGRYAARFLSELHAELGDWSKAAGAYHSRMPVHANRYRAIFDRHLAAVQGRPPEVARLSGPAAIPDTPAPRVNTFPLLQPGAGTSPGSLVPLSTVRPGAGMFGPATAATDVRG